MLSKNKNISTIILLAQYEEKLLLAKYLTKTNDYRRRLVGGEWEFSRNFYFLFGIRETRAQVVVGVYGL